MKKYYTVLLLTASLVAVGISKLSGQTCRVCNGVNAEGVRTYMEVYEYDYVTQKPTFPGGDQKLVSFINKHREYPQQAYNEGIQGRVICSFVINPNGAVSNVSIIRGVEPTLNAEAVRIITMMPKWTPGKIRGKAVPVRVIYPIPFRK